MKKIYALILLSILIVGSAIAQSDGDYRSAASGLWSSNVWEKRVAGAWDNGFGFYYAAPSTVPSGVTVTVRHYVAVSGTSSGLGSAHTVTNNGIIEIESGQTLQIGFSTGFPPTPYFGHITGSGRIEMIGNLNIVNGTITVGTGGVLSDEGGILGGAAGLTVNGEYDYTLNGGTLINGITWGGSSVLKYSGLTNSWPGLQSDDYNDLEIASSGLTANLELDKDDAADFNNIEINNTGSFAIATDAGDLTTVTGNLTIGASGKLIIQPTSQLTVSGTMVNNATISDLVINSDASRTGSLITSSTVSGTFNQYVSSGQWHLLGIPVAQGSGATLGDFNPASGDGYMRAYETANSGWGAYMTDETTQLSVGTGYEYWTTVNNTINVTGVFNNGAQNNTLLSTGNKYNCIANPYPCSIDWTTVSDRSNVVASTMYMYANTAGTEGYFAVNGSGVSTPSGANEYIPPFQGIFVEQSSGSSLNFSTANKAHGDKPFYKQSKEVGYSDLLRLHVAEIVNDETMYSELVVLRDENATNDYDIQFDTKRFGTGGSELVAPSLYALASNEKIIINSISSYPAVVPIELEIVDAGDVTLTISELSYIEPYTEIRLEDSETGEFYNLDEEFSGITFGVEPGIINDRFFVHYNTTVGLEEDKELEEVSIYANKNIIYIDHKSSESFDVQVMNMMGQTIYEGEKSGSGLSSISLDQPAAYYIVRLIAEEHTMTKKLYIAK